MKTYPFRGENKLSVSQAQSFPTELKIRTKKQKKNPIYSTAFGHWKCSGLLQTCMLGCQLLSIQVIGGGCWFWWCSLTWNRSGAGCKLVHQSDLEPVFDYWPCWFSPCFSFPLGNTPADLKAPAANCKRFLGFRQHFGEVLDTFKVRQVH